MFQDDGRILQRMHGLTGAFATNNSCIFYESIFPSIWHPENSKFHQLLKLKSFLHCFSQFVFSMMSSQRHVLLWQTVNNDVSNDLKATTENQSDIRFYDRQFKIFVVVSFWWITMRKLIMFLTMMLIYNFSEK